MMYRRVLPSVLAVLSILFLSYGVACGPSSDVVEPQPTPSPGALHNAFLGELHAALDARGGPAAISAMETEDVVYAVTNDILERYGEPPMTHEAIDEAQALGVEIAQSGDPWRMVQPLMSGSDYKWLRRYVDNVEVHDARRAYGEYCAKYGAPVEGSVLWTCLDITVSSAEYWYQRDLERALVKGDVGPQRAWWKRVIAAVVVCTADGVAGTVAGAGGGGVVGGVVVGYLASYAVDDIIEGRNY